MQVSDIEQETMIKEITKKKKCKKGKMVVWGDLTNSWEKKEVKGNGGKERYAHLNAEFQKNSKER